MHLKVVKGGKGNSTTEKLSEYDVYPTAWHFERAAAIMANSWDEYLEREEQDKEDGDKASALVSFAEAIAFEMWIAYSEDEMPSHIFSRMLATGMIPDVVKKADDDEEETNEEEAKGG